MPKFKNIKCFGVKFNLFEKDCLGDIFLQALDLDLIIDWAGSRARDRASGQGNLFDLSSTTSDQNPGEAAYNSQQKNSYHSSIEIN